MVNEMNDQIEAKKLISFPPSQAMNKSLLIVPHNKGSAMARWEAEHRKKMHDKKVKAAKAVVKLPGPRVARPPSSAAGSVKGDGESEIALTSRAASVTSGDGNNNEQQQQQQQRRRSESTPSSSSNASTTSSSKPRQRESHLVTTTRAKLLRGDIDPNHASDAVAALYENSVKRLARLESSKKELAQLRQVRMELMSGPQRLRGPSSKTAEVDFVRTSIDKLNGLLDAALASAKPRTLKDKEKSVEKKPSQVAKTRSQEDSRTAPAAVSAPVAAVAHEDSSPNLQEEEGRGKGEDEGEDEYEDDCEDVDDDNDEPRLAGDDEFSEEEEEVGDSAAIQEKSEIDLHGSTRDAGVLLLQLHEVNEKLAALEENEGIDESETPAAAAKEEPSSQVQEPQLAPPSEPVPSESAASTWKPQFLFGRRTRDVRLAGTSEPERKMELLDGKPVEGGGGGAAQTATASSVVGMAAISGGNTVPRQHSPPSSSSAAAPSPSILSPTNSMSSSNISHNPESAGTQVASAPMSAAPTSSSSSVFRPMMGRMGGGSTAPSTLTQTPSAFVSSAESKSQVSPSQQVQDSSTVATNSFSPAPAPSTSSSVFAPPAFGRRGGNSNSIFAPTTAGGGGGSSSNAGESRRNVSMLPTSFLKPAIGANDPAATVAAAPPPSLASNSSPTPPVHIESKLQNSVLSQQHDIPELETIPSATSSSTAAPTSTTTNAAATVNAAPKKSVARPSEVDFLSDEESDSGEDNVRITDKKQSGGSSMWSSAPAQPVVRPPPPTISQPAPQYRAPVQSRPTADDLEEEDI